MSDDDSRDDDVHGRFSHHWLRMSELLAAELKKRDLTDTPEAQAFLTARRRMIRRTAQASAVKAKARPETKWQAFLRIIGRPPGATTKH